MPDENTQAVVNEADTLPPAGSEVESARATEDELAKALAEFEEQTKPTSPVPPTPQPQPQQQPSQVPQYDQERLTRIEQRILQEDLNKSIESVSADTNAPRRIVKGYLEELARENYAFAQAFLNKDANPKQWERLLNAAAKDFYRDWTANRIDEAATSDKAAVINAVRGASTRQPEERPADYSNMSTQEYRQAIRKEYGFDPGV